MSLLLQINPAELIEIGGIGLLLLLVFIETGFLIGILVPGGDPLLVTAGLLCGSGVLKIHIGLLVISVFLCAFSGDLVAYTIGGRMKNRLFKKKENRWFKRKYVEKTKRFYKKYGGLAIIFGRFLPIVRTINPLVSGAIEMNYSRFFPLTALATISYSSIVILASYYLGSQFPLIKNYLAVLLPLAVLVVLSPALIHLIKYGLGKKK